MALLTEKNLLTSFTSVRLVRFFLAFVIICLLFTSCSMSTKLKTPEIPTLKINFLQDAPSNFNQAQCNFTTFACYLAGTQTHSGDSSYAVLYSYANSTLFQLKVPSGFQLITGLSCFSNTTCYAAGAASGFGGVPYPAIADISAIESTILTSWPSEFGSSTGLACATEAQCLTTGLSSFFTVTQNGWQSSSLASGPQEGQEFSAMSCIKNTCLGFATSEDFILSTNNIVTLLESEDSGESFSAVAQSSLITAVTSLSCISPTCFFIASNYQGNPVLGRFNLVTHQLSLKAFPTWIGYLNQISCVSQSICLAGGATSTNKPLLVITQNSGQTFSALEPLLQNGYVDITTLSCSSLNNCLASAINQSDSSSEIFSVSLSPKIKSNLTFSLDTLKPFSTAKSLNGTTIMVVGDSIATSIQSGLMPSAPYYNATITGDFATGFGCGLIPKPHSACQDIFATFKTAAKQHPNLVFVETGIWDLGNFKVNGKLEHFGDKEFDKVWLTNYEKTLSILTSTGAKVIALSLLYTQNYLLSGQPNPFQQPNYIDIVNNLIQQGVASNSNVTYLNLNNYLYPQHTFNYVVHGKILRPDNHHFSYQGSLYLSTFLYKQAASLLG